MVFSKFYGLSMELQFLKAELYNFERNLLITLVIRGPRLSFLDKKYVATLLYFSY